MVQIIFDKVESFILLLGVIAWCLLTCYVCKHNYLFYLDWCKVCKRYINITSHQHEQGHYHHKRDKNNITAKMERTLSQQKGRALSQTQYHSKRANTIKATRREYYHSKGIRTFTEKGHFHREIVIYGHSRRGMSTVIINKMSLTTVTWNETWTLSQQKGHDHHCHNIWGTITTVIIYGAQSPLSYHMGHNHHCHNIWGTITTVIIYGAQSPLS